MLQAIRRVTWGLEKIGNLYKVTQFNRLSDPHCAHWSQSLSLPAASTCAPLWAETSGPLEPTSPVHTNRSKSAHKFASLRGYPWPPTGEWGGSSLSRCSPMGMSPSRLLWYPALCHTLPWPTSLPSHILHPSPPTHTHTCLFWEHFLKWLSQQSSPQKESLPLGNPAQDIEVTGISEIGSTYYIPKGTYACRYVQNTTDILCR